MVLKNKRSKFILYSKIRKKAELECDTDYILLNLLEGDPNTTYDEIDEVTSRMHLNISIAICSIKKLLTTLDNGKSSKINKKHNIYG
jgi:hypothetical protein